MPTYNGNKPTHSRKSTNSCGTIRTDGGRISVTFKVDDETLREIDAEADEQDITRSEHLREILDSRDKTDDLRQDIEKLEQTIERLENEKRLLIQKREEHTELVKYVEEERELRRQHEQRENAPVWRRAKWWVLGRPEHDTAE
jgi:vacuolar-type H+-ATPase subunit I/STV1